MMLRGLVLLLLFIAFLQVNGQITRIEFNSGTRTYRQQIILTSDSAISIEEDFRINLKPVIARQKMTPKQWDEIISCLDGVQLEKIAELKSPTDKRTYDAAAHGSIIITTAGNKSYTHGFDNEDPHSKLKPLMQQLLKFRSSRKKPSR